MSRKVLMAFGSLHIAKGFPRFREQAEAMNVFDEINCYTEKDLDKDFKKLWGRYLIPYSRGYGYWCWKPYLIYKTLERMKDGDILLYTDIGCFFNPKGLPRLNDYYEITKNSKSGILGVRSQIDSYLPDQIHWEHYWTKGDVFDYFGVRGDKLVTHTTQFESTITFFRKDMNTLKFVADWYKAYLDDYSLATDTPSKSPNFPEFVENRHDQSIYSMLCKKYKVEAIGTNEIFQQYDWTLIENFPIHAMRDKAYPTKFHYKHRFRVRQLYQKWWQFKYFFKDIFCGVHDKNIRP